MYDTLRQVKVAAMLDELELIEKEAGGKMKALGLATMLALGGMGAKSLAAKGGRAAITAPSKMQTVAKTLKDYGTQSRAGQRIGASAHEMAGVMP